MAESSLIAGRPHHVLWKGRGKVHAVRPPRFAFETEHAGMTWCALYASFRGESAFVPTDAPLTCKTCLKRDGGDSFRIKHGSR